MTFTVIIMLVFSVALVLSVIGLIWQILRKNEYILNIISTVVSLLIMLVDAPFLDIKPPEIYATNGNSVVDNKVQIKSDRLFKVYYTTIPYADPRENGELYVEPIDLTSSITVSARASFLFNLFWSDTTSIDLVVGEDSIRFDESESPGSSISAISVVLNKSSYFPGTFVSEKDLIVSGTTIAGEEVIITDYIFEPFELVEGLNTIEVRYLNLCSSIKVNVVPAKLMSITAEYIGGEKHVDEEFAQSEFKVTGLFEDGTSKEMADFAIEPITFSESGNYEITVSCENCIATVTVEILPKEYLFALASEMHTPTGSYVPNVYTEAWTENVDYAVDGKTYGDGIKLTIDNWMSGLMGNGTDFREEVTSNMYINVNQDMLERIEPGKKYFEGWFVVHKDTNGSTTTANISVYADDVLVYQSGAMNAASTKIPPFKISVDGVEQIRIETIAQSSGNDFIIGCIVQ